VVLLILSNFVLFKTRFGLRLRSVGEHPEAAETLGINVGRMRHAGVLISGALTGLGGAWLALDQHSFTDGMSAGRGFIALAAMIIGKWKPGGAIAACLLFGFAESLAIQLQGGSIPTQFIQMIPYVLTMVVLAGFIGRSQAPAADGIPYEKERTF
jgi:simple sugar transport system permease protein